MRNQYLSGIENVNAFDAAGVVVGSAGIGATFLSSAGVAPGTMSAVSTVAGRASIYLAAVQNWLMMYEIIFKQDWEYNTSSGDFETDFMIQIEQSKGFYNDADYFR